MIEAGHFFQAKGLSLVAEGNTRARPWEKPPKMFCPERVEEIWLIYKIGSADCVLMASHNEYQGYVKLPKKKLHKDLIRLDFNGHIETQLKGVRLEGISLRMSVAGSLKDEQPEISMTLTPEQWLDLIDAMKAEFESVQKARKNIEDLQ